MLSIPGRQIGSVGSFGGGKTSPGLRFPKQGGIWRLGVVTVIPAGNVLRYQSPVRQFSVWGVLKPRSGSASTEARLSIKVTSVRVDDT